jgi:periodic tryptophan protein 2
MGDRMTAANAASGKHFTSVCYTVDGSCIMAGGNSKYVCIYDIGTSTLLKKFQISENLSLDGMHEKLDSRNMTEAGDINLIDDPDDNNSDDDARKEKNLPGARKGDLSLRAKTRPEARTKCVRFAPTGRTWAAASTEGLLLYSLDDAIMFDPYDLEIDITPDSIMEVLHDGSDYLRALVMSFRLGEKEITQTVFEHIPVRNVPLVAKELPRKYLERLLKLLVSRVDTGKYIHLYLTWSSCIMRYHGQFLKDHSQQYAGVLRGLVKSISKVQDVVSKV